MTDIAELEIAIKSGKALLDINKLDEKLKQLNKTTKKSKRDFSGLGTVLTAVAGSAVIANFIKTAGAFQSMSASLETVTGSAEKATMAMDGIREFAKNTPFQVSEITGAFIKLKALGIEPSERSLMSFGNTASAMGKSLDQFIEAVADATTGEFERLKEFGIKARSEGDNVAFTFQGITTTVKKNSDEINKYLVGIGENNFGGAMEKQMDTINGKLSNLGDVVDDFFVKFSEAGGGKFVTGTLDLMIGAVKKLGGVFEWAEKKGMQLANLFSDESVYDRAKEINIEMKRLGMIMANTSQKMANAPGNPLLPKTYEDAKAKLIELSAELTRIGGDAYKIDLTEKTKKKVGGIDEAGAADAETKRQKMLDKEFEQASAHTDRMIRLIEMETEAEEAEEKKRAQLSKDRFDVAKGLTSAMSTLMASSSKKEFETGKKFAVANALIKGYEAVTSSYAAGAKIGGPWLGAAYAAAAALATRQQIRNIRSQQFGGGGSVSVAGGAGGGVATGASFNGGAPAQAKTGQEQSGGTTYISLVGNTETFTGNQVNDLFDQFKTAIDRGDKILFDSNSMQALELAK